MWVDRGSMGLERGWLIGRERGWLRGSGWLMGLGRDC